MEPIILHQGDDLPSLFFQIFDEESDCFIDLSDVGTIVTFKFREKNTDTVLETIVCAKIDGGDAGFVEMVWPATALDATDGRYEGELSVDFNGDIQTIGRYFLAAAPLDDDDTLELKLVENF